MTGEVRLKLLRELLRLHERYGQEAFRDLALFLRNRAAIDDLAAVLAGIPAARTPTKSKSKAKPQKSQQREVVLKEVNRLVSSRSQSDRALGRMLRAILKSEILRSSKSLKTFALEIGVDQKRAVGGRVGLVAQLLPVLRKKSARELQKAIEFAGRADNDPSQLARWTQIIVKGD